MREAGINKRLYDRRKELDYSILEASIRLDISTTHLKLIENGYIKVRKPELKRRFIFKYNLPEDFFDVETNDGYPSPLEEEKVEEINPDSKFVKFYKSIFFKIGTAVLTLLFLSLIISGVVLNQENIGKNASFYSENYQTIQKYASSYGKEYSSVYSSTSVLLLSSFDSIESCDSSIIEEAMSSKEDAEGEFIYASLNFPTFNDYYGLAFFQNAAVIESKNIFGSAFDVGKMLIFYESRMNESIERVHFRIYSSDDYWFEGKECVHISADYDDKKGEFKYNLIEINDLFGSLVKSGEDSYESMLYKWVFEYMFDDYEISKELFFDDLGIVNNYYCDNFLQDQIKGQTKQYSFENTNATMGICGVVFGTITFALFISSLIVTTEVGKKVMKVTTFSEAEIIESKKERTFKPLPKNNLAPTFIPEFVIRIFAILLILTSSLSIYYIFKGIFDFSLVDTLESLAFRADVASFSIIAMVLIFFLKLDVFHNRKSTFFVNFVLFFAGIIFYALTLLLSEQITTSPALNRFSILLDFLPGNIVWGILAFNLLSTFLFTTPKFHGNQKKKLIIYRCAAILPILYMVGSAIVQIGKKGYGWNIPLPVSSLFFTKAVSLTLFAILYCLVIFAYRKYSEFKYGVESAEVYRHGNRYIWIKNLLVCLVVVAIGLLDMFAGKTERGKAFGFGNAYVIMYCIPLILFYAPHRGKRNGKWDVAFIGLYGLSLLMGIILIISSISVYITSL